MSDNNSAPTINQNQVPPYSAGMGPPYPVHNDSPKQQNFTSNTPGASTQVHPPHVAVAQYTQQSIAPQAPHVQPAVHSPQNQNGNYGMDLPPLRPVFGISLEDLFTRDGSAVPMVVYQCLQAVDLFGLEVEGIYRLSGTASHLTKLRSIFDNGTWKNGK